MAELENWLAAASPMKQYGFSAALAVTGVALWLLGRSMARPLGAATGLLAGAATASLVGADRFGPMAVIVGSCLGCAAAWLLFRLWMAGATAALAASLAFGTLLIWPDGKLVPDAPPEALSTESPPEAVVAPADPASGTWMAERATEFYHWLLTQGHRLWEARGPVALIAVSIAGLVGFLGGFLAPYWSASMACAAVGSIMALSSLVSWELVAERARATASAHPFHAAGCMGLITLTGVALQWIIFRSRSD